MLRIYWVVFVRSLALFQKTTILQWFWKTSTHVWWNSVKFLLMSNNSTLTTSIHPSIHPATHLALLWHLNRSQKKTKPNDIQNNFLFQYQNWFYFLLSGGNHLRGTKMTKFRSKRCWGDQLTWLVAGFIKTSLQTSRFRQIRGDGMREGAGEVTDSEL